MRATLVYALCLAAALCALPARAQNRGFQLNRYEPTAAGEWSLAVDHPWFSGTRYFAGGLTLNYGHDPLVYGLYSQQGGSFSTQGVLIQHQLLGHVDLAGSFLNRVLVTVSLPVTLLERGDPTADASFGIAPVGTAAVGDPRIGVMARLYGEPYRDAVSVSLGAYLWAPINTNQTFPLQVGETGVRVLPKLVLGGLSHHVLWSFTGGFYYRPSATLGKLQSSGGNTIASEIELGAAVAYADLDRRFSIGPEAIAHTSVTSGQAFQVPYTDLEVMLGAHYNLMRFLQIGVGGGLGVLRGPGTPDGRFLLRLAYAPMAQPRQRVEDRDHDGVPDALDACPDEPGPISKDPAHNGCPPPADRDGDGVLDNQDQCPDVPEGDRPDKARPGCPLTDKDGDGVYDNEDQCPEVPRGDHPDASKPGCPLTDKDGDGVYDNEDQCPEVVAGPHPDPRRPGCPDKDTDGDAVFDGHDQCPDVPAGLHPDPQKLGCPLPDRDRDQVPDEVDACPDKPGAPSTDPKKNGCPGMVEMKGGMIRILQQVFFATGKDVILKKSFPLLQAVADVLKAQPQIRKLEVEGHTDNVGRPERNLELSESRAGAVLRFLVKEGIEESRLQSHGYGDSRPIADNKTVKGRALNRRVDFRILDPAQPDQPVQQAPVQQAPVQQK